MFFLKYHRNNRNSLKSSVYINISLKIFTTFDTFYVPQKLWTNLKTLINSPQLRISAWNLKSNASLWSFRLLPFKSTLFLIRMPCPFYTVEGFWTFLSWENNSSIYIPETLIPREFLFTYFEFFFLNGKIRISDK